jgi:hypothetical protein
MEATSMLLRWRSDRDPWWDDGQGARKDRTRQVLIGNLAFGISIVACGLTAAAWARLILPALGGTPLG